MNQKTYLFLAAGLFILATTIRLWIISSTMVLDDEAYYYVWTHHLAWGYIDGGPTIAFVNALGVWLFGANGIGVRIGAVALMTGLSVWLPWWGARRFGARAGWLMLLTLTLTPALFASSIVHTYDTEMAAFMLVAIALYYDAFFVDARAFYPAGFMLGLALLSKVSVLFSAVAIAMIPLLIPGARAALRDRRYYLSFALAALVFLPFIAWNITHEWAFLAFKGGMAFRGGGLKDFAEVWAAQLILFGPILCWFALALPIGVGIAMLRRRAVPPADAYFALVALAPMLYFGVGSLFSRYYGNWVGPAFFGGILLTTIHFARGWGKYRPLALGQMALCALFLGLTVGTLFSSNPVLKGRWNFTNRYYEYLAIATELKPYLAAHPQYARLRIVANNYQIPSLINLYVQPKLESTGLSLGTYHETMYTMQHPRPSLTNQTLLFLHPGDRFPYRNLFATVTPLKTFTSRRGDCVVKRMTLWLVEGYTGGKID